MIAGTLEIQMMANIARLANDMNDAKRVVNDGMDAITKAAETAKMALGALGVTATAAGFVALIEKTIETAAALQHLSDKTGASVEGLSALRAVAKLSGTDIDSVGAAMNKLSKNLIDAKEDGKGAAQAIAALGLDFQNFKAQAPDQQMLQVALALNKFEDGAGKSQAAMLLFGKAGAEMLPMLKDLAEKGALNGKVTAEQARQAEEFEKSMIRAKTSVEGAIRSAILPLIEYIGALKPLFIAAVEIVGAYVALFIALPAVVTVFVGVLNALTVATTASTGAMGFFGTTVATIGPTFEALTATMGVWKTAALLGFGMVAAAFAGWKIGEYLTENFVEARLAGVAFVDGTMTGWQYIKYGAEVAWLAVKTAFNTVIESVASGFATAFEAIAKGMAAIGMGSAAAAMNEFAASLRSTSASSTTFADESAKLKKQLDANVAGVHAITNDMADAAIAYGKTTEKVKEHKDTLDLARAAVKEHAQAMDTARQSGWAFIESLDKLDAQLEAQLDTGKKLTAAETERQKLEDGLANGTIVMTENLRGLTEAWLDHLIAVEKTIALRKEEATLQNQIAKDYADLIAKARQQTDSMQAQNDTIAEQNVKLTMTNEQWQQHKIYLLLSAAAELEAKAATKDQNGALDESSKILLEQAKILRDRAGLVSEGIVAKEARDAADAWARTTRSINDGLTNAFMNSLTNGKSLFVNFRDSIENMFLQMVLRPTVELVLQPFANALNGIINSALSSFTGGVLGSPGGGGGGILGNLGGSAAGSSIGGGGGILGNLGGSAAGGGGGSGILGAAGSALGVNAAGFTGTGLSGALGIGASAGVGVTTSGVVGGGAGAAIGTDLGFLGAESAGITSAAGGTAAATGGGSSLSSLGPWALAAVAALLISQKMWGGETRAGGAYSSTGAGARFLQGPSGGEIAGGVVRQEMDAMYQEINSTLAMFGSKLTLTEFHAALESSTGNRGGVMAGGTLSNGAKFGQSGQGNVYDGTLMDPAYGFNMDSKQAFGAFTSELQQAGIQALEAAGVSQADALKKMGFDASVMSPMPIIVADIAAGTSRDESQFGGGFALGGDFSGGWRIVGERGPELEATGASRIFNADQTKNILGGSATSSDPEIKTELQAIRRALERNNEYMSRTADATNGRNQSAPILVQVVAA